MGTSLNVMQSYENYKSKVRIFPIINVKFFEGSIASSGLLPSAMRLPSLGNIGTGDAEVTRATRDIMFPWQHVPALSERNRFMALCNAMGLKPSTMGH